MTEPCTIRRAIAEDASAIRAVADASWQAAYSDFLDDEEIQSALDDWYDVERLEQSLEDPNHPYFIAEVDGEVRGYASVNCTDSTVVKLSSIYTHPDWWARATGRRYLIALSHMPGRTEQNGSNWSSTPKTRSGSRSTNRTSSNVSVGKTPPTTAAKTICSDTLDRFRDPTVR